MIKRIKTIKEKLEELKGLDKGFSVFGASRHQFRFNSTLSEQEIKQIETNHGITLSLEYKEILKHLGNGGAGCGYGLEPMSLKNIDPPYIGSEKLLRNWADPAEIEQEMVDIDEISGYIKLFDYGCGMETCLIVKGEEIGSLVYFDCDERFEKIENRTILDIYDYWLEANITELKRVQQKLNEMSLQEVIDEEWALDNFTIKEIILSLIDAEPLTGNHSGGDIQKHLEKEYEKWAN